MSKKGFTLIELLVVVAVLALLASIVFSNLGGAREGARISNALSFQSQTHSLLGSDLVGWWNFNDSDARYKDISGYDYHGSCTSCPTVTDGVSGTGGNAMSFSGTETFVDIGHTFPFLKNESFTVSFWVNFIEFNGDRVALVGKGHYYNNTWNIEDDTGRNNGIRFELGSSLDQIRFSIPQNKMAKDRWMHITAVYNGSISFASLYLDGINENNSSYNREPDFNNSRNVSLNKDRGFGVSDLLLDDVRIYSRALTASEIQTLYAQTKDKYLVNE